MHGANIVLHKMPNKNSRERAALAREQPGHACGPAGETFSLVACLGQVVDHIIASTLQLCHGDLILSCDVVDFPEIFIF